MVDFVCATDAMIERARRDPLFKQQLLTSVLEQLLAELHRQQKAHSSPDKASTAMIREAARLAARLADIIRELDENRVAGKSAAG